MPFYEYAQAQTLIQLAHQNQTTVGGHPSALEIDLQRAIERELKGPILCLTHLHATPIASKPASLRTFLAFYQTDSSLRYRKSGFKCVPSTLSGIRPAVNFYAWRFLISSFYRFKLTKQVIGIDG